ncbi:hypothetical protein T492DRAFT_124404 [Pavlovales sp. CCMP2436]|nr:hypothetical protein T492DRAFT_124404 [Pavlovales sp. CCMP2436]
MLPSEATCWDELPSTLEDLLALPSFALVRGIVPPGSAPDAPQPLRAANPGANGLAAAGEWPATQSRWAVPGGAERGVENMDGVPKPSFGFNAPPPACAPAYGTHLPTGAPARGAAQYGGLGSTRRTDMRTEDDQPRMGRGRTEEEQRSAPPPQFMSAHAKLAIDAKQRGMGAGNNQSSRNGYETGGGGGGGRGGMGGGGEGGGSLGTKRGRGINSGLLRLFCRGTN